MFRYFATIAIAMVVAPLSTGAFAYCSEPSAPTFYGNKPDEPFTPYCIDTFSKTHNCSEWEIDSYNRDVEAYNDALRSYQREVESYIDELSSYVDEAVTYAKCEISNL